MNRRTYGRIKRKWDVLVGIFFLLLLLGLLYPTIAHNQTYHFVHIDNMVVDKPSVDDIKAEIIRQANIYGVSVNTALRIAECESSYQWNAKNPNGTAKGVYQFIDKTWQWIGANGNQYDYKENIKQFMENYPIHPNWWVCR